VFTKTKKVESKVKGGKRGNGLLRLFRSNDISQGSLVTLESTGREDAYNADPKTIGNAMVEAEYQNAKALLAFQKSERFH